MSIKIGGTQALQIIVLDGQGNCPKSAFFGGRSVPENFQKEFFSGAVDTHGILMHSVFKICMLKGSHGLVCRLMSVIPTAIECQKYKLNDLIKISL